MNHLSPAMDTSVHELAVGCEFVHAMMADTRSATDSRAVQLLKSHLLRTHCRHLHQLRAMESRPRTKSDLRGQWSDLAAALRSTSEDVVVGACALLERALLAAYDRALARSTLAPQTRRLLHQQRQELKCCYEYYVCRLTAWRKAPRPGPTAPKPGNPVVAVAA